LLIIFTIFNQLQGTQLQMLIAITDAYRKQQLFSALRIYFLHNSCRPARSHDLLGVRSLRWPPQYLSALLKISR